MLQYCIIMCPYQVHLIILDEKLFTQKRWVSWPIVTIYPYHPILPHLLSTGGDPHNAVQMRRFHR